jgi:hypothetical protein
MLRPYDSMGNQDSQKPRHFCKDKGRVSSPALDIGQTV